MMARVLSLGGWPIEQYDSPNGGGAMSGHRGDVLHIAQGFYRGTINWQMNPDQRLSNGDRVNTCSTWVVGREMGEWAQMRDTDLIAWCQRDGSRTWLSIELAGFAPAGPSMWQIEACAQLLAWSAHEYGHPIAIASDPSGRGLGHHSMDREWLGEEWGHDACPGSGVLAAKPLIVQRALAIASGVLPPQPQPIGGKMVLGRVDGSNDVYRGDGLQGRVKMHDPDALTALTVAGHKIAVFASTADMDDAMGALWTGEPVPPPVTVDVTELVAALVPVLVPELIAALRPVIDEELDEQSRAGADVDEPS